MSNISEKDAKVLEEKMNNYSNALSIGKIYELILEILDDYIDMEDEEKKKIAMWVIGASLKDCFETFPILYINASMSSGKTRLLKLLNNLIPNSLLTTNLTEAVLFRIPQAASLNAMLIDEAEGITSKEQGNLKELLNSCYKKGSEVIRMRKVPKTESYEAERFDLFLPVAIANITGLEGVVESRAISIIMEKSNRSDIIKKMEIFTFDDRFEKVKKTLSTVDSVVKCSFSNDYLQICLFLNNCTNYTNNINNIYYTNYTNFIELIKNGEIGGRELEIWLPLFTVASHISDNILKELYEIALSDMRHRRESDIIEDRDTSFLLFLHNTYFQNHSKTEFQKPSEMREEFRELEGMNKSDYWPSSQWIGRCLKRLKIIIEKRRLARGVEVMIDYNKIQERIRKLGYDPEKMLKEESPSEENEIQKNIRQQQLDDINREEE